MATAAFYRILGTEAPTKLVAVPLKSTEEHDSQKIRQAHRLAGGADCSAFFGVPLFSLFSEVPPIVYGPAKMATSALFDFLGTSVPL